MLVYDSGIMMNDYMGYLQGKIGADKNIKEVIYNADFDTLRAILT